MNATDATLRDLPEAIAHVCMPLFEALSLENAMPKLVGSDPKHRALVEQILRDPALHDRSDLAAGLWLYVDDLDRSHVVSQSQEDVTGSLWHGIMHRREGDFSNAHYWMRRAARHPLLQTAPQLDPDALIDAVQEDRNQNDPALVQRQRDEWAMLFRWCAADTGK